MLKNAPYSISSIKNFVDYLYNCRSDSANRTLKTHCSDLPNSTCEMTTWHYSYTVFQCGSLFFGHILHILVSVDDSWQLLL